MEIINRKQRMFSVARDYRREKKSVGFVPTMGALHEGHLSLIREARLRCDVVIVSIFVNPTQFNQKEDFEKYPRDITADSAMLADLGVDYVFAPDAEEIYGVDFASFVEAGPLGNLFEGASRPGHFRGVATVVTILLNTVRPDFAFFGQKDAQQVAVVRRLVRELGFECEVVALPIVREASGLAMSSRNERLSPEDRARAAVISRGLFGAKQIFESGETKTTRLVEKARDVISEEPSIEIDYIAVVDSDHLGPIEKISDRPAIMIVAVTVAGIRLIDNIEVNSGQ